MAPRNLIAPLLVLTLAPAPSLAAAQSGLPSDVQQVVDGIEATYKGVNTLQANFAQVVRSAAMGAGETQRGVVMLSQPRMMRWDFDVPDDKLFVTDGSTMWVYTPAEKQVFITEELGSGDGNLDQLLDNLDHLDEYFLVEMGSGAPAGSVSLQLKPKGSSGQFKRLDLVLARQGYALQKLVIVDAFDNQTELSFSNLKINPKLAASEFSFQVPAGVTVVRADGL